MTEKKSKKDESDLETTERAWDQFQRKNQSDRASSDRQDSYEKQKESEIIRNYLENETESEENQEILDEDATAMSEIYRFDKKSQQFSYKEEQKESEVKIEREYSTDAVFEKQTEDSKENYEDIFDNELTVVDIFAEKLRRMYAEKDVNISDLKEDSAEENNHVEDSYDVEDETVISSEHVREYHSYENKMVHQNSNNSAINKSAQMNMIINVDTIIKEYVPIRLQPLEFVSHIAPNKYLFVLLVLAQIERKNLVQIDRKKKVIFYREYLEINSRTAEVKRLCIGNLETYEEYMFQIFEHCRLQEIKSSESVKSSISNMKAIKMETFEERCILSGVTAEFYADQLISLIQKTNVAGWLFFKSNMNTIKKFMNGFSEMGIPYTILVRLLNLDKDDVMPMLYYLFAKENHITNIEEDIGIYSSWTNLAVVMGNARLKK